MVVNIKKIKVILISVLMIIEICTIFLMYKSLNNKKIVLDNVMLQEIKNNGSLAIMIEQSDGSYKETSENSWPEDMMFNEEKSGCVDNNGQIIENALVYEDGIATVETGVTSNCYLYFDLLKDDITIAISTDGESGVMPSSDAYTNTATCSSGSITWSQRYQRIEIGGLNKPTICKIKFLKDTSSRKYLKDEVESKATTKANGYRYSGKQPDNYIWFNNEMWRIIGSIPVCLESSCGTNTTNLVKIIRDESIGGLSYDANSSNYTGTWGSNTLYTLLNSYYYGKLNGTDTEYCYGNGNTIKGICDYRVKGINPIGYYGKMLKNVYWNTGSSDYSVKASKAYTNEIVTRSVSGYVGLMNISDYAYAADKSYHSTSVNSYNTTDITKTNWLFSQGNEWTIITYSSVQAVYLTRLGNISTVSQNGGHTIRPVIYLDSLVYILGGDGTITNPYIIGM